MDYEIYVPLGGCGSICVKGLAASPEEVREIAQKLLGQDTQVGPEEAVCVGFRVGDIVETIEGEDSLFGKGHKATILEVCDDGAYFANFNGHGNSWVGYDGLWWINDVNAKKVIG